MSELNNIIGGGQTNLLLRRRMIMAKKQSIPPAGYTQVKSIKVDLASGSVAYVVPITSMPEEYEITIDCVLDVYYSNNYISAVSGGILNFLYYAGAVDVPFNPTKRLDLGYAVLSSFTGKRCKVIFSSDKFIIENSITHEKYVNESLSETLRHGGNLVIPNKEASYPFPYFCVSVIASGVELVNLVPCVRDSDGVASFYDTVNQVFLEVRGGSRFIVDEY